MTVYDLIVIGGGFWGTACAVEAQERGLDTLLLDDDRPMAASRNAAGIVSLGWYRWRMTRDRKDVTGNIFADTFARSDADYGVRWLLERGLLRQTGEEFFSLRGNRQFRSDLYLLSSPADLFQLAPRKYLTVLQLVRERGHWLIVTREQTYTARGVVLAAGAFTDELLTASGLEPVGVTGLRGRGLLLRSDRRLDVPYTVQIAPYSHVTLRPWSNGLIRVGDTVEKTPGGDARLEPLQRVAGWVVPGFRQERMLDGLRPVLPKVLIKPVAPGLVVATGGHRVGLALAPRAAQLALEQLEA